MVNFEHFAWSFLGRPFASLNQALERSHVGVSPRRFPQDDSLWVALTVLAELWSNWRLAIPASK
jgi:hypothetical protein